MLNRKYETIIIGGGISGLSCAGRLYEAGRDFILITENLGGRIFSSKLFDVNYGAAYITDDYTHVLKYVDFNEPMKIKDFFFFDGKKFRNLFDLYNLHHIPAIIRLLIKLMIFRRHIIRYRKKAPHISIKESFETDSLLIKYWKMPAKKFIKKHGFEKIDRLYVNLIASATAFVGSEKLNTFCYLSILFPLLRKTRVINFKNTIQKLTSGYEDKIISGSVYKVQKFSTAFFSVKSSVGNFFAQNIVFAAPHQALSGVYDLPKPHIQKQAYVFHIAGLRKKKYRSMKAILFGAEHHHIFMLWRQKNGEDIIYSKTPELDLALYYESYEIVKKINWNPGMIIPKDEFVEQKIDENMYLASDYNLSLLEDSFLTGLYAANQIIKSYTGA